MIQINNYLKSLILLLCAIILTACGSGSCNTATGPVQDIHTFPNGAQLFGKTSFTIQSGESAATPYTLKGGSGTTLVNLSAVESINLNSQLLNNYELQRSCFLCGTFAPESLVVTGVGSESSSVFTLRVNPNLKPGNYVLNLYATYTNDGVTQPREQIGVLSVLVESAVTPTPTPTPTVSPTVTPTPTPTPGGWVQLGGADISGATFIGSLISDSAGNIYAGGGDMTGNTGAVWKWDGISWSKLGGANISGSVGISKITQDLSGNIYAGGCSSLDSNNYCATGAIWKWDGSSWTEVGGNGSTYIHSLALAYDGTLYVAGSTSRVSGAVWTLSGTTWTEVDNKSVFAIAVDGDSIAYAAGMSQGTPGNMTTDVYSNGSGTWSTKGIIPSSVNAGPVMALTTKSGNDIYAGGNSIGSSMVGMVWHYDGSSWSALGGNSGITGDEYLYAMIANTVSDVYVGGLVTSQGGPGGVWHWDGSSWSSVGDLSASTGIYSILQLSGKLYASGASATGGSVWVYNP